MVKTLKTTVDYFCVDLDENRLHVDFSSDVDALITAVLSEISAAKFSYPAQRILLQRHYTEELVNLKLLISNTPKYSVARTTKSQRRDVISCFEDIIGDDYEDILQGYINGENEIGKLRDEMLTRSGEHRLKEQEERDRKRNNPIWKVYITVEDYLKSAIENEFIDFRYAKRAVEELDNYLKNKGESVNDDVLESVHRKIEIAYENQDEKIISQMLSFLRLYGDALWSQLD